MRGWLSLIILLSACSRLPNNCLELSMYGTCLVFAKPNQDNSGDASEMQAWKREVDLWQQKNKNNSGYVDETPEERSVVSGPQVQPTQTTHEIHDTSNGGNQVGSGRLIKQGGVFTIPVKINGVMSLDFIVDSGASDVQIPADVASTLLRTQTIKPNDFLPGKLYRLADGSIIRSRRFSIRSMEIGGIVVRNVPAGIGSPNGELLLGQSFLSRFPSWSIDNKSHRLVLGGGSAQPRFQP